MKRKNFFLDFVFVVIKYPDTKVLVGSIYARLFDGTNSMKMTSGVNTGKIHCNKNQPKCPIVLGVFNARHTAWGDTMSKS